jgi:hypothetical protein
MYHAALCASQKFSFVTNTSSPSTSGPDNFSLEERIYWSSWKSESELRWELRLRDFDNRAINHPPLFPCPPDGQSSEQLRSWYFYLSEISLWRHHFSAEQELHRLAHDKKSKPLEELMSQFGDLERQIVDWQQSLAPPIYIGNLEEDSEPEDDFLKYLLRTQAGNYWELITWPFISAAVKDRKQVSSGVKALIAKGVNWHCRRLAIYTPGFYHRHRGTWLMQRRSIRSALLLLAAALTPGVTDLMPLDWTDKIHAVIAMLRRWSAEICDADQHAELLSSLLEKYIYEMG